MIDILAIDEEQEESYSSEEIKHFAISFCEQVSKLIDEEGEEGLKKLRTMITPTADQIASHNFSFSQFYNL
jgi:hypothetical protein